MPQPICVSSLEVLNCKKKIPYFDLSYKNRNKLVPCFQFTQVKCSECHAVQHSLCFDQQNICEEMGNLKNKLSFFPSPVGGSHETFSFNYSSRKSKTRTAYFFRRDEKFGIGNSTKSVE